MKKLFLLLFSIMLCLSSNAFGCPPEKASQPLPHAAVHDVLKKFEPIAKGETHGIAIFHQALAGDESLSFSADRFSGVGAITRQLRYIPMSGGSGLWTYWNAKSSSLMRNLQGSRQWESQNLSALRDHMRIYERKC